MNLRLFVVGALVSCGAMGLAAQDVPAQPEEPVHTLHVYTDLVQVPTLVLQGNGMPLTRSIEEHGFSISIDYGPWFKVTHSRLEGGDPISLSILLDTHATDLMSDIEHEIAALAPKLLTARDHVSIYALDCNLTRSLNDVPADAAKLMLGVHAALGPWITRKQKKGPACVHPAHLWDSLGYIATELQNLPGRRVILVVTDEQDRGSVRSWNEVRAFTQQVAVAVFAVTEVPMGPTRSGFIPNRDDAAAMQAICELSGGMVMATYPAMMEKTLQQVMAILRGRYILEFPRPSNSTSGRHDMRVKVAQREDFFIRPSGISVPIQDPSLLKDPTTIQADPSHTPEEGKRRIKTSPK